MFCGFLSFAARILTIYWGFDASPIPPAEEHGDIYEDSNLRCLIFENALALYEFMHSLIRQKPVSRNVFTITRYRTPDAHREHNQIEAVRLRDGVKAAETRIEDKKDRQERQLPCN